MVQGHTASKWVELGLELGSAFPALGSGWRAPTGSPWLSQALTCSDTGQHTVMLPDRVSCGNGGALPRGSEFLRSWHRALSREEERAHEIAGIVLTSQIVMCQQLSVWARGAFVPVSALRAVTNRA